MSNDKAIIYGKEKRKPYRGGKAIAYSCRNHGDCLYCMSNRTHASNKRLQKMMSMLSNYQTINDEESVLR